jgi:hypothetical protein
MQTTATKQQVIAINTAIHHKNLMGYKAEMVEAITAGRTSSSKELTFDEARALLTSLNAAAKPVDEGKKMRANIIAMAHEMHWIKKTNGKDDYSHLDGWMLKYSYLKKKLYSYTYKELPTLVTQFKNVYLSHLKK